METVLPGFEELSLWIVVPKGGGECREFELTADPKETVEKLKKRIEKICGIPADDLELFAKNTDDEASKQKWLTEDKALEVQEVRDGAVITVGVHGMKGDIVDLDPETGELPTDAVNTSICSRGDSSYYHAHRRKADLPEEHRIVSGGAPQKLGESSELLPEPKAPGKAIVTEEGEEPGRSERPISNYAWGDEKDTVKIYISAESEPKAIASAGDGKAGEVEVDWQPRSVKLRVRAEKFDWVLELGRIYYEIVPEESKFRVSKGKRVTLTLKKKEQFTWLKLLKPE